VHISYKVADTDEDGEEDWNWENIRFDPSQLKKIDSDGSKYVFVDPNGVQLVLTKVREKSFSYWDAL
jgi:hypothetical protein